MDITGRTKEMTLVGKPLTICNQRHMGWTHPYDDQTPPKQTLSEAGCGIFSIVHAIQWMRGEYVMPDELAEFSCAHGGRGDDGTDRPALLEAMTRHGLGERYGFRCEAFSLQNDVDALYTHLSEDRGTALCNLRVGHIVALVAAKTEDGARQALAIDSYSESADARVRGHVLACIKGSEIVTGEYGSGGVLVGKTLRYAAYWADIDIVRDYNLLIRAE